MSSPANGSNGNCTESKHSALSSSGAAVASSVSSHNGAEANAGSHHPNADPARKKRKPLNGLNTHARDGAVHPALSLSPLNRLPFLESDTPSLSSARESFFSSAAASPPSTSSLAPSSSSSSPLASRLYSHLPTWAVDNHALIAWDSLAEQLRDKTLAVFLDYDGTLTPIVDDPYEARLSDDTRRVVRRLSEHSRVAIVSGRQIDVLKDFVRLDDLFYAASHGFIVRGPGDQPLKQVADDCVPALAAASEELSAQLRDIPGALVENGTYSVTVHYRQVENGQEAMMEKLVDVQVQKHAPLLKKTFGKKVYELRPNLLWHKGKAVELLLDLMQQNCGTELTPIYIGDDVTDEDALQFVAHLGRGLGICVQTIEAPRETAASHILFSTEEVKRFLCLLTALPSAL